MTQIHTIGHSTLPVDEFIGMLKERGIETLVDIRTIPRSRFNPQFSQTVLARSLKAAGIRYEYMKDLGGLRQAREDSVNTGWRNKSFRGYADYMQTPIFHRALEDLIDLAKNTQTAIMCAEAVPWRCHRSLVADALTIRGIGVTDIMSMQKSSAHKLTPFARVHGETITYPDPQRLL